MTTISLPFTTNNTKEFVAVPRKAYAEFVAWQRKIKSLRTFEPTAAEKRAIKRAQKDFERGDYVTLEEMNHELARRR